MQWYNCVFVLLFYSSHIREERIDTGSSSRLVTCLWNDSVGTRCMPQIQVLLVVVKCSKYKVCKSRQWKRKACNYYWIKRSIEPLCFNRSKYYTALCVSLLLINLELFSARFHKQGYTLSVLINADQIVNDLLSCFLQIQFMFMLIHRLNKYSTFNIPDKFVWNMQWHSFQVDCVNNQAFSFNWVFGFSIGYHWAGINLGDLLYRCMVTWVPFH